MSEAAHGLPEHDERVCSTIPKANLKRALSLQGRRLAAFTLVLGSESPEVVYDGQYIRYDGIPPGMEAQFDFAKETADNIVEFLLSDRIPVEGKSRVRGRPYLPIPMADGTLWKLKKFD